MQKRTITLFGALALLILMDASSRGNILAQDASAARPSTERISVGRDMGLLTVNLIEIGIQTDFFLTLAGEIQMTQDQRKQITEIAYRFQRMAAQKKADLKVAEAELDRILSREQIEMLQVKSKLSEVQAIEGAIEYAGIEAVLEAINTLKHEQHTMIVMVVARAQQPATRFK